MGKAHFPTTIPFPTRPWRMWPPSCPPWAWNGGPAVARWSPCCATARVAGRWRRRRATPGGTSWTTTWTSWWACLRWLPGAAPCGGWWMPSCGNEESNGGEVREHSCWMLEHGGNFEWETHDKAWNLGMPYFWMTPKGSWEPVSADWFFRPFEFETVEASWPGPRFFGHLWLILAPSWKVDCRRESFWPYQQ